METTKQLSFFRFSSPRTLSILAGLGFLACTVTLAACPKAAVEGPPCGADPDTVLMVQAEAGADQANVQGALVVAWPGSTVCLGEGTFRFDMELTLETSGVTIKGQGLDKTILDFTGQDIGANGIAITGDQVTLQDLSVKNTPGDGIRAQNVEDIVFRRIGVIWDADSSEESGAYGLYPVGCTTVLIENSVVKGARDAGIYVGQSTNIIVRDNEAYGNVAGIEIENSHGAEVYGNHAHDNTAGILVFNLPGLPIKGGSKANVHDNLVENNNLANFAPGGIIKNVPSGIGMLILACDDNEFHKNTIRGNSSTGIIIAHYIAGLFGGFNDPEYNLYSSNNWIHDNIFEDNGAKPDGILAIAAGPKPLSDVLFDGCAESTDRNNGNCMSNNGAGRFTDMDLCPTGTKSELQHDVAAVTCTGTVLPTTTLTLDTVAAATAPPRPTPLAKLSEYGFFEGPIADQKPGANTHAYAPVSPLYSDYTAKDRFLWLPPGKTVSISADGSWNFPEGAIVVKTFAFDADLRVPGVGRRLIETRLFIRDADVWRPETYLWNEAQTEAEHHIGGDRVTVTYLDNAGESVTTPYLVPNLGQCANCHAQSDKMELLGVTTPQMNGPGQLDTLAAAGLFDTAPAAATLPALVDPFGATDADSLDERARAYLHANCSHCHTEGGAAESSGLRLSWDVTNTTQLGICKQPAAAGAGGASSTFDIHPGLPEESIMIDRMKSTKPAVKMPELPNLRVHTEGLALIEAWIAAMPATDCSAPE